MSLSHPLLELLHALSVHARTTVAESLIRNTPDERSRSTGHAGSDVIYALDQAVETGLVRLLEARAESVGGLVMVAEGIGEKEISFYPSGRADKECAWRLLVDPIDGTRGIMMDKRSAWFLAGVAPNRGEATRLRDIECSVMAELPNSRAGVSDLFSAVKGQGMEAERCNLMQPSDTVSFRCEPYTGPSVRGGFAQVCRFFPGGRDELALLEEKLWDTIFPDAVEGEILCFEDQYICTGGEWVELMTGRDRFCADLRGTLFTSPRYTGRRRGHVCHPYDMAGLLVAEEAGVILTDIHGNPLDAPFDTTTPVDWIGYANASIRTEVEATLQTLIAEWQD
ncbi:MAG: hypothetical protein PF795_08545 [Kiritimatiellae bacterium]|jgi:hypothetical protein|nr:hypothetical protein [Kiritimatiellia bacterium]